MRILGISGSLRADSHNTRLLRAAAELLPPGAELVIYDAGALKAIPPFDEDDERGPVPEAVEALRETIAQADAVLFATPEYNASIPGVLKNAVDWMSRAAGAGVLRGKPVAVIGASTGLFGAVWAQAELRKVLEFLGAKVVDRELPLFQAPDRFDEQERLHEQEIRDQLVEHLQALVDSAAALRTAA